LALQVIIALLILHVPFVKVFFEYIGKFFILILDFTKSGSEFLFNGLMDTKTHGFIFAFQVLPAIIFFSALTSLLFYLGVVQFLVRIMGYVFMKTMALTGPESLCVAGNIFLGQSEAPLLIKGYLPSMKNSEIALIMISGLATIAGSVLAAYVGLLGGDSYAEKLFFARHLITASVMAAPGAVVISKILLPAESEKPAPLGVSKKNYGKNMLDAISNGTIQGVKLAVNVAAILLVFIAFIAMFNYFTGKIGEIGGINEKISVITDGKFNKLSLQLVLSYIFMPFIWIIGVAKEDLHLVSMLLGEKIILTEFIGYISLAELKNTGAFYHQKSIIMSTYILCGFANFASVGIQIGVLGTLIPSKKGFISKYSMKALIGGTIASLLSASIIGMLI
jgi:CNT family concentrative nucleoside transporter